MSAVRSRMTLVAVLAFAALVVGLPAGRTPLWDPNEARYMLLARDILDRGRWLIPDLRGEPYLNKPQLFFWAVAVASLPGGEVTERTAALPAVLSSIATVAAVFAIGARTWGVGTGGMAALVLASTIGFFAIGHHGQSDVMVTAWTWWALYGVLVARRTGYAALPLVGFYTCVAGAIMSKGPMGLLGLAAGFVAVAVADGWRDVVRLRPTLGLAVLVVLLAPWYGTYLVGHGSAFVGDTVVGHYSSWAFRRGALARLESLWVLAYALPWTIFFVGAATCWRRRPDAERRLIAAWTLAIWLLVGLSGIHRARYLIPVYPGLALLVGEFLTRAAAHDGAPALRRAFFAFAALAGLVAALGIGAILLIEGARYPARFAREFDVRPIAAAAQALTPPGSAVRVYPDIWLTYDFYLRRPVVELDRGRVEQLLSGSASGAVIMSRKSWTGLHRHAHSSWRVVAARRVANDEMVVLGGGGA